MNKRAPYNDFKNKRNNKINRNEAIGDLLLNLKCVPNKSKNWSFYAKGMVKYVADHQELLTNEAIEKNHQNKNIDAYGSYLSYISRDSAKKKEDINPTNYVWHYTNLKQYRGKDISTFSTKSNRARLNLVHTDNVRKIHPNSHIWSILISEKDINMKDIMFNNQHQIVDRIVRPLFPFPVDATLAFHGNTEHPHIHIMVYQPENTKNEHIIKKWKMDKNKLELAKKSYFYFLINNKNYFNELLNEKSKLRQSYNGEVLQRYIQKELYDLLNILAKDKQPLLDQNGNQVLNKLGFPVYQMKFQFNRLNKKAREKVIEIKEKILNLPTNEDNIVMFQEQYKKFKGIGSKLIEDEFDKLHIKKKESLIMKTNELFNEADEKICQQILKTAKDFYFNNKVILNKNNSNLNNLEFSTELLDYKNVNEDNNKNYLTPSVWKAITNNYSYSSKEFYHSLNEFNLNENLSALKQLIKEIEAKNLNFLK